jgi:hypothetical protein
MKNLVLIDFTLESMHALDYAIGFSKATNSSVELVNVATKDKWRENMDALEKLKTDHESDDFKIGIHEMVGDVLDSISDYINHSKGIGFVFVGAHDKTFLEKMFQSRVLKLMNESEAHFVFIPKNLNNYSDVNRVAIPVNRSTHALQPIRIAKYLAQFTKFHITFLTFDSKDKQERAILSKRLKMAMEISDHPNIDCSSKIVGYSENDLRSHFEDYCNRDNADLAIFVNTYKTGDTFQFSTKGFIENIIRNKSGIPIIGIQDAATEILEDGLHLTGGG